jgi:hypothetical protein
MTDWSWAKIGNDRVDLGHEQVLQGRVFVVFRLLRSPLCPLPLVLRELEALGDDSARSAIDQLGDLVERNGPS